MNLFSFHVSKRPFLKVAVFFLVVSTASRSLAGAGGTSGVFVWNSDSALIREHSVRFLRPDKDGKLIAYCSGIIQNPGEVITAGHCLKGLESKTLYIEVYDSKAQKYQRFQVLKRSAMFDHTEAKVDLGVATFLPNKKMGLPNKSLPVAFEGCDKGSKIYTSGFGLNDQEKTGELRINEYEVAPPMEDPVVHHEVFLKSKNGQACFGDSGGPVFCKSKGRLAILAISSNIYQPMEIKELSKTSKFCRTIQYLRATDFNGANEVLQKLREEESTDSDPVAQ